jgi:hypothetical protein
MDLLPADLIFVRSRSLVGRIIRWAERSPGEAPSWANHVAGIGVNGQVIEALFQVKQHPFKMVLSDCEYEIWRKTGNISDFERERIAHFAGLYLGERYGWWKLGAHLADAILGRVAGREVRLIRRVLCIDSRPICSWVWAHSYYATLRYEFGVAPNVADPDQMHDWVREHEDWENITNSSTWTQYELDEARKRAIELRDLLEWK